MNRILLVDDEVAILEALEDVLTSEGFEVSLARHGAEALESLPRVTPHLILTDLMMPVMDGHTLLRHLADSETYRHIPVMVMSAGRFEPRGPRSPPFIAKPFELDHLLKAIHRELRPQATAP